MSPPVAAHSWEVIADTLRNVIPSPSMADLVDRIVASPYAAKVHAFTSMDRLVVGPTPMIDWSVHYLMIESIFRNGVERIRFRYECPGAPRRWQRECAPEDAFATFERFLRLPGWSVPPPA